LAAAIDGAKTAIKDLKDEEQKAFRRNNASSLEKFLPNAENMSLDKIIS